jgi:hypothetical protein
MPPRQHSRRAGRRFDAARRSLGRREMRRRAAIEPVIGHLKQDHRMGGNYLTGRDGDRINAVLAAAGYNFSLLLRWFEELLRVLSLILCHAFLAAPLHLTGAAKLSSRPTKTVNTQATWCRKRPNVDMVGSQVFDPCPAHHQNALRS